MKQQIPARRAIIDDIRRNLTPILGHLSMLIDGDETPEQFATRAGMLLGRSHAINSAVARLERLSWTEMIKDEREERERHLIVKKSSTIRRTEHE